MFGRAIRFHSLLSISISFSVGLSGSPRGVCKLVRLAMTQLPFSCLVSSCARMLVYPTNSICNSWRKIISGLSFSFLTSTRNGRGSLHVIIAGSGSLPSILMSGGGGSVVSVAAEECFLNKPDLGPGEGDAWNWCCLRAYDSRRFGGWRGGSMGKNLKVEVYGAY